MLGRNAVGSAVALGVLLLSLAYSMSHRSDAAPIGEPNRGRVVYDQYCASCHGESGRGDGRDAIALSPRPASLISAATSAKSDKDLLRVIAEGKPHTAMRAWNGTLTSEEQRDVLAYIRTLVRFVPSLPSPPSSASTP